MQHSSSTDIRASSRAAAPTARICLGLPTSRSALSTLKPDRIAGIGGLETRHDAMVAAERGADYVMFGDNARPSLDAVIERVAWWARRVRGPLRRVMRPRSTRSRRSSRPAPISSRSATPYSPIRAASRVRSPTRHPDFRSLRLRRETGASSHPRNRAVARSGAGACRREEGDARTAGARAPAAGRRSGRPRRRRLCRVPARLSTSPRSTKRRSGSRRMATRRP